MAKRYHVKQTAAPLRRAQLQSAWGLLLLFVALLALPLGCREEASNDTAPVVEAEPRMVAAAPAEAEGPVPQEAAAPAPQEVEAPAPKIVLAKTVHDFGEIGPGTAQNARFEFKNEGNAPLKITQVRSCCGVVTRGVKAGQVYAPGESGALELDYRASTQPGSMTRNLYIQSNDPKLSTASMTIKATIVPRIRYEPARLKLFTNADNAGAKDIVLTSLDGRPFSVKGFRATAGALKADFDPTVEATRIVLKPKADVERLRRNNRGRIRIDLTHPECQSVSLLYDVLSEFTVDHEQIMLFNLQAGQTVKREVWVMSNYQKEFEIESVSSQKGTVKLVDQRKQDSRYGLTLEITPPPVESDRAVMSDVVEVKIKGGTTLSIACRGFYQGK
ncbi:MAG: DUF1573 domain-containing protein [Phycisphaerales bacterium]|nr:MAG: DUF1573 domain-containing protein [Phycisphaerales bacterium]